MEDERSRIEDLQQRVIPLKPIYEGYNAVSQDLIERLRERISIEATKPSSVRKQNIVLASFLATAQQIQNKYKSLLGIARKPTYYAPYPEVGHSVVEYVTDCLVRSGLIEEIPNTGIRHFWEEDNGLNWVGIITCYSINTNLYEEEGFLQAQFLDAHRPLVQVSVLESYEAKMIRESRNQVRKKLKLGEINKLFPREYRRTGNQVAELNTFQRQHPLGLPPLDTGVQTFAACATRTFHQASMEAGGRYYGAWTTLGSQYRLGSTIDGEPVAEIDLNASQPTLFSAMMGIPMKVGDTWDDLYVHILDKVDLSGIDSDDTPDIKRKKIKQVAVEVIGTGNNNKEEASPLGKQKFVEGEFARYRDALNETVPALLFLDKHHFNGAGFISYHEAQMMTATLHRLMSMDIPAFSIHDCCLVKEADVLVATDVYRDTIRNYIKENGKGSVDVTVPVSIERKNEEKERMSGYFH